MEKQWAISVSLVVLLLSLTVSPVPTAAFSNLSSDLRVGPFVDEIEYIVIPESDDRIAAILTGDIEIDNENFNPSNLNLLAVDFDISIAENLRNGYGHLVINCRDYPLNISGFRRAFAFAYDKRAAQQNILLGYSQLHDSIVPATNSFCIEEDLDWHYYDADPITGNQILDDLGFELQGDGWRTAPNGTPIDIEVSYPEVSPDIAGCCAQLGVDALVSLHIHAHLAPQDFNTYMGILASHGEYDMFFYATDFHTYDIDWLAYSYWSERANEPLENPTNFMNATYDSCRNPLLHGTTYKEVYAAAAEMQKILHYNVPLLVVYENIYMQAYRNDQFTGHVPDLGRSIAGLWTMRKIYRLDGSQGGIVAVGVDGEPDNFNIWHSTSTTSKVIFDEIYPSLYARAPDLTPYPYLATEIVIETHEDNQAVLDGHTRFTIDIIENATWSDGTPLTARDVAFSYNFPYDAHFNGWVRGDFVSAYTLDNNTVAVDYETESFLHFNDFAYQYIVPYHIFNEDTGIGYVEAWDWNPVFDPDDPLVTAGPFLFSNHSRGEFYELTANPDFWFTPPPDHVQTSPRTSETGRPLDPVTLTFYTVSGISSVVIVVMVILILRNRRTTLT